MSRHHAVGLTIILAAAAACAADAISGPPVGFQHAVMTPACGPADGPAVAIYLASTPVDPRNPATPYVRISVWDAPDRVGGRTWRLGIGSDSASAVLVTGPNDFNVATGGHVTVGVIDTTSTTQGSAELVFTMVGRFSGAFRAAWSADAPLCG